MRNSASLPVSHPASHFPADGNLRPGRTAPPALSRPSASSGAPDVPSSNDRSGADARSLYRRMLRPSPDAAAMQASRHFLQTRLAAAADLPCELPVRLDDLDLLDDWMLEGLAHTGRAWQAYLADRRGGAPRRYFTCRAHALHFLRGVAPTKLVDGAWLCGLLAQWNNPLRADLVRTCLDELGDGQPDDNHVCLYRALLAAHGIDEPDDLPDDHYEQGAIQLALAAHADDFLPEIAGFNLGYEQLPLHLLITAHELDELGIDPGYFRLHITIDNADSGHARRAINAVKAALPRLADGDAFLQRLRNGYRLNALGAGTLSVIDGFEPRREVERIVARKSRVGRAIHGHGLRIGARTLDAWLAEPARVGDFIDALQAGGWIHRHAEPGRSRFWHLLQGARADMRGVFSPYELQVIHDWIRGDLSTDGASVADTARVAAGGRADGRPRPFRARRRMFPADETRRPEPAPDADMTELRHRLARARDDGERISLLLDQMGPATHWTPLGLYATRTFIGLTR